VSVNQAQIHTFSGEIRKSVLCQFLQNTAIGLAISDKKIIPWKTEWTDWFVPAEFRLFRGTGNSRNSVPNHSLADKNAWNSVQWNKNRNKPSELQKL